jgi:hypothetical protein
MRLIRQIEVLRVSKQVEINDAVNVAKKVLQSGFQEQLTAQRVQYEGIVQNLTKKVEELAALLFEKSQLAHQLNSVITDQAVMLSILNVDSLRGYKDKTRDQPHPSDVSAKDSVRRLRTEITSIKEVCLMYEAECRAAKIAAKEAKEAELMQIKQREGDKLRYDEKLKVIEDTIKAELEAERLKNVEFQAGAASELELREALNDRQHEMITALQDELKSAKHVLKSTRLHSKFIEAYRLSVDDSLEAAKVNPIRSNLRRGGGNQPKALSTLPKLEKSGVDLQTSSRTPTYRHLRPSPDTVKRGMTLGVTSFS